MKSCRRDGHTLFEILLALGLSLVLLVAVYSALDMHWKFSAAGREEMERLQLTRALTEKMRLDVRDIVYRDVEPIGDERSAGAAQRGGGEVDSIRVVRPGEAHVSRPIGLVGDTKRLLMQVGRPSREHVRSSAARDQTVAFRPAEQRFVSWFLGGRKNKVLRKAGEKTDRSPSKGSARGTSGLVRLESDRLAASRAAGSVTLDEMDAGQVLATEVTAIRFRYFDGATWHEAWDSVQMRRLPRAVEVTLSFRPLPTRDVSPHGSPPAAGNRVVIAVPLAEPLPAGREL